MLAPGRHRPDDLRPLQAGEELCGCLPTRRRRRPGPLRQSQPARRSRRTSHVRRAIECIGWDRTDHPGRWRHRGMRLPGGPQAQGLATAGGRRASSSHAPQSRARPTRPVGRRLRRAAVPARAALCRSLAQREQAGRRAQAPHRTRVCPGAEERDRLPGARFVSQGAVPRPIGPPPDPVARVVAGSRSERGRVGSRSGFRRAHIGRGCARTPARPGRHGPGASAAGRRGGHVARALRQPWIHLSPPCRATGSTRPTAGRRTHAGAALEPGDSR